MIKMTKVEENNNELRIACYSGNLELVNLLIKKGVNDYAGGAEEAIKGGHLEIFKLMIKKIKNNYSKVLEKLFKEACKNGNLEIVKLLIEKNEYILNRMTWKYFDYEISFSEACKFNHIKIIA